MSKPFDATLNSLIDAHPADWAAFLCARLGVPPTYSGMADTDLSLSSQADNLFRLDGPPPGLLHLELQSNGRLGIPGELLRYNVLARGSMQLPVHSFIVLLRPKANASDLTGTLELPGVDGANYLTFRYSVIRVWREKMADLLNAGLGLAPLALLTDEADADLDAAFGQFQQLLRREPLPDNIQKGLYGPLFVLCGLRYNAERIRKLYETLSMTLEDSTTYQWILNQGVAQGVDLGALQALREGVQDLGRMRFGPLPGDVEAAIAAMLDRERLKRIHNRIFDASGWDDLVATA